jgi:CheY-like chemotaxis protein
MATDSTPPLILVVEDNPANLLLVRSVLGLAQFQVASAGTIAEARSAIAKSMPDLVLMDVRLPDGDGLELTRELKTDASTASIPIVVLTAHAMAADNDAARAAGCDGFITKPIHTRTFAEEIKGYLTGGKASSK